jgi:DNA repair protein RadA/Sms
MAKGKQVKTCVKCDSTMASHLDRCPVCRAWNWSESANKPDSTVKGIEPDGTILLSEVESADAKRIHTAICSDIFGKSVLDDGSVLTGIVNTSVILIGGGRGAGKSTLMTQTLSEISAATQRETMYIACEEALAEIKLRGRRLGIPNMHQIRMVEALSGASNVHELVHRRKPAAVVLDSLKGMVGDDTLASLEACKLCKIIAVENSCPVIIIQHVTKDDQIAGSNDDQHEVDTVATFFAENNTFRLLEIEKNRFGQAYIGQRFVMSDKGLTLVGGLVGLGAAEEDASNSPAS